MMRTNSRPASRTRNQNPGAGSPSYDFVLAAVDRLSREKAELLEEVRQLRAAVSIYRRIAEQMTANQMAERKTDAA
jgi:hypothetical protein